MGLKRWITEDLDGPERGIFFVVVIFWIMMAAQIIRVIVR